MRNQHESSGTKTPALALYLVPSLALLVACQSSDPPRRSSPQASNPPAAWEAEAPREAPPTLGSSEPDARADQPVLGGLGTDYRPADSWEDTTQGPLATLIYMSATGSKGHSKPYPLIYSSDPNNTYFYRQNSARLTIRRLKRDEMQQLLSSLRSEGFDRLPWEEHGFRDKLDGERALTLYQAGACRRVVKANLGDAAKKAFTRVEKRIIQHNRTH